MNETSSNNSPNGPTKISETAEGLAMRAKMAPNLKQSIIETDNFEELVPFFTGEMDYKPLYFVLSNTMVCRRGDKEKILKSLGVSIEEAAFGKN